MNDRDAGSDYHPRCARHFFQKQGIPELPYTLADIKKLAEEEIRRSCASVSGVQKKISLEIQKNSKTQRLTLVGIWGRFILKPPTDQYPHMPLVEHLSMVMAKQMTPDGNGVVPHALIRMASGELAYMSRRVDRPRTYEKTGEKLHMEDMCQLSERLTEDKYKSSMEHVAKIIKEFSSNPMLDVVRFFEMAIFSFLIGNADMHLKNFSLLIKDAEHIVLSPAYDLLSTRLLISEKDDPEEMALTLNGKKGKLSRDDFDAFGSAIGLKEKQIDNSMSLLKGKCDSFYRLIDISFLPENAKEDFKHLLQSRAQRLEMGR